MPFDRKDFEAAATGRKDQRERELMPLIRLLQSAAPVMAEMMTGSDDWNRYLAILSGFVDRLQAGKATATARLADPGVWEPTQLTKLKSDILTADAMLDVLQTAMQLPKAIIDGGEAAAKIVKKFEARHEATSNPLS